MVLAELLNGIEVIAVTGNQIVNVTSPCFDSRVVVENSLFIATRGTQVDGHQFISKAIACGATAIVCETLPSTLANHVTYVQVQDSAEVLGKIAANYFCCPSDQLQLVGVTGTNGKTTSVTLLHQLFRSFGCSTGLISTVATRINDRCVESKMTTPDALTLNNMLSDMVYNQCTHAFMEVSSHSIHQNRIAGVRFRGGVFTNLTRDHLDYHGSMDAYFQAKKAFFDNLTADAFALTNASDSYGLAIVQDTKANRFTYGIGTPADFVAKIIDNQMDGLTLDLDGKRHVFRLRGRYNAYNLLVAYAVSVLLGQDTSDVIDRLGEANPPEGRFECIISPNGILGVVDYAHTPDALDNILKALIELRRDGARLITVVGCGGDRDHGKRPLMAGIVCGHSDEVYFTSDNPRSEDPQSIIEQMLAGVVSASGSNVHCVANRRDAIQAACDFALPGDIVLVAGKGHEKYQEISGIKHPFDDRIVLSECLSQRSHRR